MKTTYSLAQLQDELNAWSDGPKHVVVHSASQYEAIKTAHLSAVEVLISNLDLTAKWLEKFSNKAGTFFIVGYAHDAKAVEWIASSRPDLDIRFATL